MSRVDWPATTYGRLPEKLELVSGLYFFQDLKSFSPCFCWEHLFLDAPKTSRGVEIGADYICVVPAFFDSEAGWVGAEP